jgi:hypothetical protein
MRVPGNIKSSRQPTTPSCALKASKALGLQDTGAVILPFTK